ncbi:DNA primase [Methylobacter sp. BlB1]|uniref:DNA primase n=1 Tax=Methylobacter sp. BlB1 TaxID=2785914 RepID=UPI001894A20E|nr:DNA primase [Methylobacter sp. BlB1]MBF6649527.1 DNA primase [Methylobacter sp. BlB1]
MSDINTLLSSLDKVKNTGPGKYIAICPSHADRRPSLSIKLTDDDKILLKCWAGCQVTEIVGAIGLTLSDLMPEKPQGYDRAHARVPRFSKSEMFDRLLHESIILGLGIRRLLNGKELSPADIQSINKAESIIDELRKEVSR